MRFHTGIKTTKQNSFTRKVLLRTLHFDYKNVPFSSVRNRMFGLDSLVVRRRKLDLIMVYKILHNLVKIDPSSFFTICQTHTRGEGSKIFIPFTKHSARFRFFVHRAGSDYLKLMKRHEISPRLSQFKRLLNRTLRE